DGPGDIGQVQRRHVGSLAAFVRPRSEGGFVVALEHGLALADAEHSELRVMRPVLSDPGLRFHDGGCSPAGTLYGGTMAWDHTPDAGSLYRFGSSLESVDSVAGTTISNGLGFSPDGGLAYFADSATGRVDVFDNDGDHLLRRRPFAETGANPDGLCVDAKGGVWVACHGAGQVRRFDTRGRLDAIVELPVSNITACTFGGADLATLFITTTRQNVLAGEQPEAGSVFAATPGVRGLPVLPYTG
ncbi:MAG: SMP-30/gluconolactonase/LRE family protein, partial [Micrococcales bacterium]|nr:SMP-30/gluconolactonase/LRE family protein [Micrococcales bacterium]